MTLLSKLSLLFMLLLSVQAQTWKSLTTANGLTDNQIRCISGDSTGTVWFGTKTKGIQGYNGTNFITFPRNASFPMTGGLIYEVTGIGHIDNKLYIGIKSSAASGYGLWVYNFSDNTIVNVGGLTVIGSQDIRVFHKSKAGQIYAGASDGFYKRIADNNWQKIGSGYVQSIAERTDGLIYYTTFDSLFTYDGTTKTGIVKGFFYSCAVDNNNNVYVSSSTDIFKVVNNSLSPLNLGGYAKSMATDKNGKVWVAGAANTFGLASINGSTITTYNSANSPLLSNDMSYVYVAADNNKYIGHYSNGVNALLDAPFVIPVTLTPNQATVLVGATKVFTASNGVRPYKWWVSPANLGTLDTAGQSATFRGQTAGNGKLYVTGANSADTASALITVVDTGNYPKLPVRSFVVSKGKFADKIQMQWTPPAEVNEGFEDGFPTDWRKVYTGADTTLWVSSAYLPHGGSACVKFDVYSPGTPETAWLITNKMRITPEKPKLNLYFRTAYALGNPYTSYIRLSTTDSNIASFTNVLQSLTPAFLADSNLQWRRMMIDLSAYVNQDVYIGFQCKAEDIIIYLDDIELQGQTGLNGIAQRVRSYKLYRSETPANIGNPANIVSNSLVTSYTDQAIVPLKNYYYAVSAVYDSNFNTALTPVNFGIAYQQNDSIVLGAVSAVAPEVDGVINAAEYSGATKIFLTRNGYYGDVYMKTSGNKLYLGYDFFTDSLLSEGDYALFAFDKDRNFAYTDSVEGLYRIRKTAAGIESAYFPFYGIAGFSVGIPNPPGFTAQASTQSGHVQFEMSIDLQTSYLNVPITRKIGAYLGLFNANTGKNPGWLERLLAQEYSVLGFGSITLSSNSCANVSLAQGWNLVSVPYQAPDMNSTVLFPQASSPAYTFNNGYVTTATLTTGAGYWLRYPQAAIVPVCGTATGSNTITLKAGWNIIGGYQNSIPVSGISSTPAGIVNSLYFGYNNGYVQTGNLEPGKGYWVRATQAGVLNVPASTTKTQTAVTIEAPKNSGRIIITDATGAKQILFMANEVSAAESYELPPVPPVGIFDARFSDNRNIATTGTNQQISLSNAHFPVTVEANSLSLILSDVATDGKQFTASIANGERCVISNSAITELTVASGLQPAVFALQQNYPNPFNPSTTINFSLAVKDQVALVVYNQLGEKVAELFRGEATAGFHTISWNASAMPSGVYFYELKTSARTVVKKMLLMK